MVENGLREPQPEVRGGGQAGLGNNNVALRPDQGNVSIELLGRPNGNGGSNQPAFGNGGSSLGNTGNGGRSPTSSPSKATTFNNFEFSEEDVDRAAYERYMAELDHAKAASLEAQLKKEEFERLVEERTLALKKEEVLKARTLLNLPEKDQQLQPPQLQQPQQPQKGPTHQVNDPVNRTPDNNKNNNTPPTTKPNPAFETVKQMENDWLLQLRDIIFYPNWKDHIDQRAYKLIQTLALMRSGKAITAEYETLSKEIGPAVRNELVEYMSSYGMKIGRYDRPIREAIARIGLSLDEFVDPDFIVDDRYVVATWGERPPSSIADAEKPDLELAGVAWKCLLKYFPEEKYPENLMTRIHLRSHYARYGCLAGTVNAQEGILESKNEKERRSEKGDGYRSSVIPVNDESRESHAHKSIEGSMKSVANSRPVIIPDDNNNNQSIKLRELVQTPVSQVHQE